MKPALVFLILMLSLGVLGRAEDISRNYECGLTEYNYETGFLAHKGIFEIPPLHANVDLPGKPIITFKKIHWYVNYYDEKLTVEVRNFKGEVIAIATSSEGSPLALQVPQIKQIIICNKNGANEALYPSIENYGGVRVLNAPRKSKKEISIDLNVPRDT